VRYRRRRHRMGTRAGDAYELFLDALCNALGVIMFIMLCVVVFSMSPDGDKVAIDPQEVIAEIAKLEAEAAQLESQLASLLAALATLPPSGDPATVKRWREVLAEFEKVHTEKIAEVDAYRKDRARFEASVKILDELIQQKRLADERLARVDELLKKQQSMVQFTRVSRFRSDPRKPILLLCSQGRVSIAPPQGTGKEISEPNGSGIPVKDEAGAKFVIGQFFAGKAPQDWRAEVVVWPSGFVAYQLIEKVLVEQKYGINPLPVPAGESIHEGVGGVQ